MKNKIAALHLSNLWLALLAITTFASCTKYNIVGSSDMQSVDGRMLYLRALTGDKPQGLDSCDVVHGKFTFSGALDSVQVVMLCLDNNAVIPVVLEDGKITIEMNEQKQVCNGTPLNDTLTAFTTRYRQLVQQMEDLEHAQNQAYMNAEDMEQVNAKLGVMQQKLLEREDKMVSGFIADNFDNCLGPYVFLMSTQAYEYPVLTPWIEALMAKATDTFKNNPIIKEYMEAAQHNQDVMTGATDMKMDTPPMNGGTTQMPVTDTSMIDHNTPQE